MTVGTKTNALILCTCIQLVISKFKKTDTLEIKVMQENSFCPNGMNDYSLPKVKPGEIKPIGTRPS